MTNNTKNTRKFSKRHPAGLWVLFTTEMWERFAFYAMRAILVLYLVDVSTSEQTPGFGWSEADAYKLYGWFTGLVYFSPFLGGWIADRFLGQRSCVVLGAVLMALGEFFLATTELIRIGGGVKITLATDPLALLIFYIGLGLLILGNGFFKPCISVMVGQLYDQGDQRRDAAFSIFYMGINIGAFFSPLVAGTVAEKYGYHLGFIIAGFGMICGLILFSTLGQWYLKGIGGAPAKHLDKALTPEERETQEKAVYEQTRPLIKKDCDRIFVILVLSLFVIAFWASFEQAGSSLNIFAKINTNRTVAQSVIDHSPEFAVNNLYLNNETIVEYHKVIARLRDLEKQIQQLQLVQQTDQPIAKESLNTRIQRLFSFRNTMEEQSIIEIYPELVKEAAGLKERLRNNKEGDIPSLLAGLEKMEHSFGENFVPKAENFTFPATWYQSVNALGIVIFAPIFTFIWVTLARYGIEPSTPTKFALGLLLVSASFLVMIPGAIEAKATNGKAAAYWLILCYLFATWGELCLSPVGLSMITKLAPARLASFFMGVWFTASSIAYILAGYLASYFGSGDGITFFFGEKAGLADFFLVMAVIPMIIGFIALALAPKLKQMMHGTG
ncbi:MAG: peptide MFS transporter [Planctomycetaceae bacterium]|jgi:POT family proton-dependent oligopeptide transporter|nr:peptide MFS transporter [Planctomycetaceae bacterium]